MVVLQRRLVSSHLWDYECQDGDAVSVMVGPDSIQLKRLDTLQRQKSRHDVVVPGRQGFRGGTDPPDRLRPERPAS